MYSTVKKIMFNQKTIIFFILLPFVNATLATGLDHQRFGDIYFGTELSSSQLTYKAISQKIEGCHYIVFDQYPTVSVMIIDDVIQRIETSDFGFINSNNPFYEVITNGKPFNKLNMDRQDIDIEEHEYEYGFYFRWYNNAKTRAIIIDYVDGKVDIIKAGLLPAAMWIEGCA
ncbi:hypothetical protein [Marinomonas foliarum]|uniref:Uncharacterized protein n=1 Tax=Marinomonas foliarum TaxID=491950 RepID=A0ABX7IPV1_9GAMM|nr:hypothetical protein [Marinomonas foliarum]QRV24357.1 hypothetical protein JSY38_02120 [Marinomonas foliarum]